MSETKIQFFKKLSDSVRLPELAGQDASGAFATAQSQSAADTSARLEPATCTEAETFVLQVLDDSMEPEFRKHCMIVIDPTGHARDGCYVLAQPKVEGQASPTGKKDEELVEEFLFRQLHRLDDDTWHLRALNDAYASEPTPSDFSDIVGVIVQRAGIRRRYHKRYD